MEVCQQGSIPGLGVVIRGRWVLRAWTFVIRSCAPVGLRAFVIACRAMRVCARDLSPQPPAACVCYISQGAPVSAYGHHVKIERCLHPFEAAVPVPGSDPERLRWLIRRIAADDRRAFAELYHRYSGPIGRGLRQQLPDSARVTGILAGTFVEVWWLAGGHVGPDSDARAWIDRIVRRRVAYSRRVAPLSVEDGAPPSLGALWSQGVEVELARLLTLQPVPLACDVPAAGAVMHTGVCPEQAAPS